MAAQSARELSLVHHLALAACRSDSANRHQINELVRSVHMAYYLQRLGFGDIPFECYERAEAAFENALGVAAKSGKWIISEQNAPVIERLLALHDQQMSEAPMHKVAEAKKTTTSIPRRHRGIATGSSEIGLAAALPSNERVHFAAMPGTKRVSLLARLLLKAHPKRWALARYGDRIAEVRGEARSERGMNRSLDAYGVERRSAVRWENLRLLDDQLFKREAAGIKPSSCHRRPSARADNAFSATDSLRP
ncbi:hypothetical protein ABH944_006236 [Caballeronia udeis]|uniref:Fis family transcriptional regulator n=1 Tax=Caballeronia udeis TaxID=1232866 RepID=A0ABW8MUJ4_9BURK